MSQMISVAKDFQYSVNIGYDLNDDIKLKNFIPTKSALNLLEEILLSTNTVSNERARVLIGAYGKGKSHIVLVILSMLLKKDLSRFEKLLPKAKENDKLYQSILNYYESANKILPVVVTGSSTSMSQAFLLALQRTLSENNLLDVMPDTNYKAAVSTIRKWQKEYPEVYAQFKKLVGKPVEVFINELENFDNVAYEMFERLYPSLAAGSLFNPFLGFDVVELYESVAKGLKSKGYTGIYVVYDEFSKYLETNISEASVSDTKMLQDFAEKCNRSRDLQMHLMLISHKEISNYIDTLPKNKVDGWRGVSERFKHIHLNNNFMQTYEIIASVIQKEKKSWDLYCENNTEYFDTMKSGYLTHPIFNDVSAEDKKGTIYNCFPLHPVTTYILPRLSERVAQNERTLFTFLSANGQATLPEFLNSFNDDVFSVVTPDIVFDYFEPLFRKEVYSGDLHQNYVLASTILNRLEENSLESKIVKTISLIYILQQFERLKPTTSEISEIYAIHYSRKEIMDAINKLIDEEYVIYLNRSTSYLKLKQSSGVDIYKEINDFVEKKTKSITTKEILNSVNFNSHLYPSRYNDDKEMTRYFAFEFISADEVSSDVDWKAKSNQINADGVVYGIIPNSSTDLLELIEILKKTSVNCNNILFTVPKRFKQIDDIAKELYAVTILKDTVLDDVVLRDEYEIVYDDLKNVIEDYIRSYTHPENYAVTYINNGAIENITRKAELSEKLSEICFDIFANTPVINYEVINKNEISTVAVNSRGKIIAALLRNELESNLGFTGSGQEVSMMRSTLKNTEILVEENGIVSINLCPNDDLLAGMLHTIEEFVKESAQHERICLSELYYRLTSPEYGIGLRKGIIPIFLSAVFHEYKQKIVLFDKFGQIQINADSMLMINSAPENYFIAFIDWNPEKEQFVDRLEKTFDRFVIQSEKNISSYDYVVRAMGRWYLALPKYTKEMRTTPYGEKTDRRYILFLKTLKKNSGGHELLFESLPEVFGYSEFNPGLSENIAAAKDYFDSIIKDLKDVLIDEVKKSFVLKNDTSRISLMSVSSVVTDWCESLDQNVFQQLFTDGTDKMLALFKTVTNDEETFIARLAKLVTGLRLEDWDNTTKDVFINRINTYKNTAESFRKEESKATDGNISEYQLIYSTESGDAVVKRFNKVEETKRGKLLRNAITADIEAMGQSISEQEKRQILMEILKTMC